MKFDLARMVAQSKTRPRKRVLALRPVTMPATMASDLYAAVYGPVVAAWQAALPGIQAEYARSLSGLTGDAAADLSGLLSAVEQTAVGVAVTLRLRLERWAARVEAAHRRKWAAGIKQATGLDISAMIGAGDARAPLGTVIERNVELVKSVSDQTRARIGEAVFRGLQQRRSAADVAADIRESVAMSRRRALNIASDQTVKITSALNTERARQAGLDYYEWVHSGKIHYRPDHKARDGQRYEYGHFGDDEPGMAPFCGCTARAVLSLDGEF